MNIQEKVLNSVVRLKSQELFGRFEIAYRLTTNEKFRSILISVSLLVIDSRQHEEFYVCVTKTLIGEHPLNYIDYNPFNICATSHIPFYRYEIEK
ncbi:unnamed protein product [Rotaria sp. Silwood1]|nr:unnamed protein product [Rotaria sp. Silwood1]CAF4618754.1 unnamed protein product [Rotaria sp. Silwood1]CAF4831608.1 unnamed protein product [Rotaria sp. Silwood1]